MSTLNHFEPDKEMISVPYVVRSTRTRQDDESSFDSVQSKFIFRDSCVFPKSTAHRVMHDATIPPTSLRYMLATFRDTDGLPLPPLQPRSKTTSDGGMAVASQSRKSSQDVARRAAEGDIGARLDCWSIHDVERSLEKIQLPGSEISLLSWLRSPNVNKAEVVKDILEHMSDRAEEHAMWMALVWRYAKEHMVWKHCQNPMWRTEDAFLDSLDGHQTARICIQFGTSTDVARRGKINIIHRNWVEDWYQQALARKLLPQEARGAAGLSKRLLGNIAKMSSIVDLDQALDLWERAIRERTTVGSRKALGWKAATTTHLLPCDLEGLTKQLEEEEVEPLRKTRKRGTKRAHSLDASDEILELRSSAGYSSLSPFGARTEPFRADFSATSRSKGKQARRPGTLDKGSASKRSKAKEAPRKQRKQPRQSRKEFQGQVEHKDNHNDKEQEEEQRRVGGRDDEYAENGESCQRENSESVESAMGLRLAADIETRTHKGRLHQVVDQASENNREKRIPLDEVNVSGETTGRPSNNLTASATTGEPSSIPVILNEACSASLSGGAGHGARGNVVEDRNTVQGRLLRTRTQSVEGEATDMETILPSLDSLVRNEERADATRHERSASPDSTTLSTDRFVESVANGSAFTNLDHPGPPTASEQGCPLCEGVCSFCDVPTSINEPQRGRMYEYAHQAHDLEEMAEEHTLRKWLRRIRYAIPIFGLLQGHGEVCVLSAQSFRSQTKKGRILDRPVIIQEDFVDSGDWTLARYADLLDSAFAGLNMDVRWHQDPDPQNVPVSSMVELCRDSLPSGLTNNPPNMLNLPDIAGAMTPSFLRMDRFRLLNLIVERCKARYRVGKQFESTPFDVASSRSFNLLAWPGAFSGAHVDSNGATWVRNLFGFKLWMFVPEASMTLRDWAQFAEDGDRWDPGDKARAVVLCPGDVFIMRAGLVHAVHTLGQSGPCLMTGGSFWDDCDLLHSLEKQLWIGKNQSATNEPIAYQLAQIVDALDDMIQLRPSRYSANGNNTHKLIELIGELRSLGCSCEDCADNDECECSREARRCTPFCFSHAYTNTAPMPCMLEERADSESVNDTGERDGDYVGSD